MTELNNSLTQMDWLQALNATSGNISPNPGDNTQFPQESKKNDTTEGRDLDIDKNVLTNSNQIGHDSPTKRENMKEFISDDEEEEYEEVDDEEEDIKQPIQNINPNGEMSLEEARHALQHIKNEASSSSSVDEEAKKTLKPPYSYASLIRLAILDAPSGKATLSEIYNWIRDKFQYYKSSGSGWKNSIRHNLSLNKAFKKVAREKDNPGKGCYWEIDPLHASKLDPKNFPTIKKKRAQPQLKIIHQQPKPKLNHALLVQHILRGHGDIDSAALNSNLCAMNIDALDPTPKVRYELLTGAQPTPEIILTSPVIEQNTTISKPHGQTVAMMSALGPSQSQLVTAQIPTKQYISSQPGAIPILISETGSESNIASYPIRVVPASGAPGDMIKLEVTCSSALSPASNNVVTQQGIIADNIYSKFSLNGATSHIAPPLQHIPAGLDIERLRGLRLTDSVPTSMAIQTSNNAQTIERSNPLLDHMSIGNFEKDKTGNSNHAATKMDVGYSNSQIRSPFVMSNNVAHTVTSMAERSSGEYIIPSTITSIGSGVSHASSMPMPLHYSTSDSSRINNQFALNDKRNQVYNESLLVSNQHLKTLQSPPKLPLHPIPLSSCEEMVNSTSNESQNIEIYTVPASGYQSSMISNASTGSKTFTNLTPPSITSVPTACVSSTFASTKMAPLILAPQLEPFSNSLGHNFSNLQCVNPTDVHVEGYLSPTPMKSIDASRNVTPSSGEVQPDLPSTSCEQIKQMPQSIECSNVDFSSVNEELLSPANFSKYDHNTGSIPLRDTPNIQRISSPKDVPVFTMPDPMMESSSKNDIYNRSSLSHIQEPEDGPVPLSPLKGIDSEQKLIDMGVEFHMMLQKQSNLKKSGRTNLHHQDRLVPISVESTENREGDMDDDDDEIEDNFNWDKLL